MRITIIGSGNVATHLTAAFKNAGHKIVQVYSRDLQNAALLAYHVGADATDDLDHLNPETDMFIISVKDDVIANVAEKLVPYDKLRVHTSGSTDIGVLQKLATNAGVFYPLQTFSKTKEVDFWKVPLCIEGSDEGVEKFLLDLARTVSNNVYAVNSAQRRVLHLSAVFACNFPNLLYGVAQQLLAESGMPFEMLRPLILETAEKVQNSSPAEVQTGPAVRGDENTMMAHLQMLNNEPALQEIYTLLSQAIIKNNNAKHGHG